MFTIKSGIIDVKETFTRCMQIGQKGLRFRISKLFYLIFIYSLL